MNAIDDVIVVGAGFAGVTAARELATRGMRVLILEARDQIGGRTRTATLSDGELIELGGAYMNWLQPHVWSEITRYGLADDVVSRGELPEQVLTPGEGGMRWSTATEQFERERRLFSRFWEGSRSILPRPFQPLCKADTVAAKDRWSISDRLDQMELTPGDRAFLESFFTAHTGVPAEAGSYLAEMRWWAAAGHNYRAMQESVFGYRLRHGTISLLSEILTDGAPRLRLNRPVERVETLGERVRVTASTGEVFVGAAAVMAVPSGVWPHLTFEPPLTAARLDAAREGMQARAVSKGYLVARGEPRRVSVLPRTPYPLSMVATARRRSADEQLMMFWGTDLLRDPTNVDDVETALRGLLPDVTVVEVVARGYTTEDPFTRGGWGVLKKGQLTKFAPHRDFLVPHGRVAFAGADIAAGWHGFIDGAIESGLVAARHVRQLLER